MTPVHKKYELVATDTFHHTNDEILTRIRALVDLTPIGVKAGDLGGYIQTERNLSHDGLSWVGVDALVFDGAMVRGDAQIAGRAMVSGVAFISDYVRITENAEVSGCAEVRDHALISGNAVITDNARVSEEAQIGGSAYLAGNAVIRGMARVNRGTHAGTFSSVGPSYSTMTWFRSAAGISIHQGDFDGTLEELESLVSIKHPNGALGKEYQCLFDFIRIRAKSFDGES